MDGILKKIDGLSLQQEKPNPVVGGTTIVYDPEKDGAFEEWEGFHPSKIKKEVDGIKAVRVERPGLTEADVLKTVSKEDMELGELKPLKSNAQYRPRVWYLKSAILYRKSKLTTGNYPISIRFRGLLFLSLAHREYQARA
jgi:hypothetical protein